MVGSSVQHMLYMLRHDINVYIDEPEYIIYIFMRDHINRIYSCFEFDENGIMYYKYDEYRNLKEKNDLELWYWHSFTLRRIYNLFFYKYFHERKKHKFLLNHFLSANEEIKRHYKNAKFIIFVYDGDNIIHSIEKKLKESEISIIYLSKLSSIDFNQDKYLVDGVHPNEEAWDIIVPLLSKKLNL